ncbi:MAG TPA: hypothetical protein VGD56_11795 [Gemmatirosa sp.]
MLTTSALTRALDEAVAPRMRDRAAQIGERVCAEDGVATAVDQFAAGAARVER